MPVFMEPLPSPQIDVPMHKDPREAYLEHIFFPGRFSAHVVTRALNVSILMVIFITSKFS